MKKKFQNPGESCFTSRSNRKEKQKNQQTLIDITENCSYDEINIDCGCENTNIIATEHWYCKLGSANVCLTYVDKSNLIL